MTWLLVAVGGAIGASARYLVDVAVTRRTGGGWPWGTLLVNVTGCAALGIVVGLDVPGDLTDFLAAGICGALTTASAFAWEVAVLLTRRRRAAAASYLVLTTVLCVGALIAGRSLGGG